MTTIAIDRKLHTYIKRLNNEQKKSLLGFIKTILPVRSTEEVYTIEQYNKELEEAEAEIARGEYYTHEQAKELFKKHLNGKSKDQMVG